MASKMLHTCLRVENLEKSIAFYQDAFGFKELRRRDFPDHAFTIVYLGLEGDDYEMASPISPSVHLTLRPYIKNIALKAMR